MGFFDWLMKGIGFEENDEMEEGAVLKPKKEKKKNKRLQEMEMDGLIPPQYEIKEETNIYEPFGEQQTFASSANQASAETASFNFSELGGGLAGYGTKNVVIHKPKTYQEVQSLIDYLKQGESAIMILEGISSSEAQRIMDFVSGAVYALSGSTQRIDGNIFLLTPEGYNIVKK